MMESRNFLTSSPASRFDGKGVLLDRKGAPIRDADNNLVREPTTLGAIISTLYSMCEAAMVSGAGFAQYGIIRAAMAAAAIAIFNRVLESLGQQPLKKGDDGYFAMEAFAQTLADTTADMVAGEAHGVFACVGMFVKEVVNRAWRFAFAPDETISVADEKGTGSTEETVRTYLLMNAGNPSIRPLLDFCVAAGFGANTKASTYRALTGASPASVSPGKTPAAVTYDPSLPDTSATRNAIVGWLAYTTAFTYSLLRDGRVEWRPPPPVGVGPFSFQLASRLHAGKSMALGGTFGSTVPVAAAQGTLIACLTALQQRDTMSEGRFAHISATINGLLHFWRIHNWGGGAGAGPLLGSGPTALGRRPFELVGNYAPLIAAADSDFHRKSLIAESKAADQLRSLQYAPESASSVTLNSVINALVALFCGVAVAGIHKTPFGLTEASDWQVQMIDIVVGMGLMILANQFSNQIFPEVIPAPKKAATPSSSAAPSADGKGAASTPSVSTDSQSSTAGAAVPAAAADLAASATTTSTLTSATTSAMSTASIPTIATSVASTSAGTSTSAAATTAGTTAATASTSATSSTSTAQADSDTGADLGPSRARKQLASAWGSAAGGAISGFVGGPGAILGAFLMALTNYQSIRAKNTENSVAEGLTGLGQALWAFGGKAKQTITTAMMEGKTSEASRRQVENWGSSQKDSPRSEGGEGTELTSVRIHRSPEKPPSDGTGGGGAGVETKGDDSIHDQG